MDTSFSKLESWIPRAKFPALPCPRCSSGSLHRSGTEDELERETASTRIANEHPQWGGFDPFQYMGRFAALLNCSNPVCREAVIVWGDAALDQERGGDYETVWRVHGFHPPPPLVRLPEGCPAPIAAELHSASSIVWEDAPSAANRLRVAVERFMDHQKVAKTRLVAKGGQNRRYRLSTHQRVEYFTPKNPEAGELLMAVKWIGNQGSHTGDLQLVEVLQGSEFLERALHLTYDSAARDLLRAARVVSRRRGRSRKQ